jgi:hypothetical protein
MIFSNHEGFMRQALNDFDSVARTALRVIPYVVIFNSALLIVPYPLWLLLRANRTTLPRDSFVDMSMILLGISMTGQLFFPVLALAFLPVLALWAYRRTRDHALKFRVLGKCYLRFLPVLAVAASVFLRSLSGSLQAVFAIPALAGTVLLSYALYLLTLDRPAAKAA